jgi:hypothetical protein
MPGGVRGSGGDPAAYSMPENIAFQLSFQYFRHKKNHPESGLIYSLAILIFQESFTNINRSNLHF